MARAEQRSVRAHHTTVKSSAGRAVVMHLLGAQSNLSGVMTHSFCACVLFEEIV